MGRLGLAAVRHRRRRRRAPTAEDQLGAWTAAATTFAAGAEIALDFDFRDAFGNVAEIDHDDVELLVKFTNTAPSRRAGAGDVVTANATRVLEARKPGRGTARRRRCLARGRTT